MWEGVQFMTSKEAGKSSNMDPEIEVATFIQPTWEGYGSVSGLKSSSVLFIEPPVIFVIEICTKPQINPKFI